MTEPYAWVDIDSQLRSKQTSLRDIPVYTKQELQNVEIIKPQWQGLTFADIDDLAVSMDWIAGARWAEAKLKEKNTC